MATKAYTFKKLSADKHVTFIEEEDFENWSHAEIRNFQIEVLKEEHKKLSRTRAFPSKRSEFRNVVDGKFDVPLASVKDKGKISYAAKARMPDIISRAMRLISKISPRKSGQYAANNILMLNGKEIALQSVGELVIGPKDIIQLVNVSEYARKMEGYDIAGGGKTKAGNPRKRKPQSSQAPQGVYRLAARLLKQQYGSTAYIKYTFRNMQSARTVGVTKGKGAGSSKQNRYPMIQIGFSAGTKL